MQQYTPVPPTLVQTTYNFHTSTIRQQWRTRDLASPGSICEISFRIINLRAAFKNGEIKDSDMVREIALDIDSDLEKWRKSAPLKWNYATIDAPQATDGIYFDGKRHVYPNLLVPDGWNSWRILRILINKIIVQNESRSNAPNISQKSKAMSVIREMSCDLCISVSSIVDTPCGLLRVVNS
jgi:hypothetical protein